jgi:hypothetical protein
MQKSFIGLDSGIAKMILKYNSVCNRMENFRRRKKAGFEPLTLGYRGKLRNEPTLIFFFIFEIFFDVFSARMDGERTLRQDQPLLESGKIKNSFSN